jgi:transmembrane sensor
MADLDRQMGDLRAQQAARWVSTLAGPDTAQHEACIEWLKESPLNVREFLLAHSIDQSLDQLDLQRSFDVDALLAQINPRVTRLPTIEPRTHQFTPIGSITGRRKFYGIAASIAIVGLIGGWLLFQPQSQWREFGTGTGEQRALQLEDGSIVHLNAHSRIALNFSAGPRDVRLIEGEALFEVHHDAQRPFRVFTRDAVIRDVGTRFNVYSRTDGMKIAVIEGSVELTAMPTAITGSSADRHAEAAESIERKPRASQIISADQQAQVDRNGTITIGTVTDIADATAWWQRRLVYRSEALAHIVEDFNRYNRRRIQLEGNDVMQRSYTGVFDADDPDSLAQVLASDPQLVVERLADRTIVIRAR